jgi:predicted ATPase
MPATAARIDWLSANQKAAIQLASVLGREFSLDLAEEVWDGHVPLEARLQELKGLEFLRERHGAAARTFVFKHALTREVAYDGILQARRRQLHGHAGAALEHSPASQRFEHCELLAYHYSRSSDPARAIPHLATAGDRARDRYANQEAIAAHCRAIEWVLPPAGGAHPHPERLGQAATGPQERGHKHKSAFGGTLAGGKVIANQEGEHDAGELTPGGGR